MKGINVTTVDTGKAIRFQPAPATPSPRERRQRVPPPIFLCEPKRPAIRVARQQPQPENHVTEKPSLKLVLRFPAKTTGVASTTLPNVHGLLSRALNWIRERQSSRAGARRLKVTDTVHLGEKRFIAVVQMDGQQYLVGGGATNVALLAQLKASESFDDLLKKTLSAPKIECATPAMQHTEEMV